MKASKFFNAIPHYNQSIIIQAIIISWQVQLISCISSLPAGRRSLKTPAFICCVNFLGSVLPLRHLNIECANIPYKAVFLASKLIYFPSLKLSVNTNFVKIHFSPVSQRGAYFYYWSSIERSSYLFLSSRDGDTIQKFGSEQTSRNYPDNAR